jgi:hypothetical protein
MATNRSPRANAAADRRRTTGMRVVAVLLAVWTTAVVAGPAAAAASSGAPIRGTLSGSGAQSVGGDVEPLLISVSDGTLRASRLGPATYHLVVMQRTSQVANLTITTHSGTLELSVSRNGLFPLVGTPFTVVGGTRRFADATGTITFTAYTKQAVECVPSPPAPAPNVFCSWDESATLTGALSLH